MANTTLDSFNARRTLTVADKHYDYFSLSALSEHGLDLSRMPLSMKVFVENLLRHEDGRVVTRQDIEAVIKAVGSKPVEREVFFMPARQ
jgi:aconitate hydratase